MGKDLSVATTLARVKSYIGIFFYVASKMKNWASERQGSTKE